MAGKKGALIGVVLAAALVIAPLVRSETAAAQTAVTARFGPAWPTFLPKDSRAFAGVKSPARPLIRSEVSGKRLPRSAAQPLTEPQFPSMEQLTVFPGMDLDREIGMFGSGREPPDTQIAVGPSSVVELVNRNVTVWSKGGTLLKATDFPTFFGPSSVGWNLFNPRVLYDQDGGRFFAVAAATKGNSTSVVDDLVYYAISNTSDPAGVWTVSAFQPQAPTQTGKALPSQPRLGVNRNMLVLSWDDFAQTGCDPTNPSVFCFVGSETILLQKSDLLTYGGANACELTFQSDPVCALQLGSLDTRHFGVMPVQSLESTDTEYLVFNNADPNLNENQCTEVSPTPTIGTCPTLGVIALTGSPRSGLTKQEWNLPIEWTTAPSNAEQAGSPQRVETGDDRILSAVWRSGKLWATMTDGHCGPNSLRGDGFAVGSCARLFEVAAPAQPPAPAAWTAPSKLQNFSFGDEGGSFYAYYPAITVDAVGDMVAVYSGSNPLTYPGVFVIGANASRTTFYSELSFVRNAQGSAPYQSDLCGGRDRFGDYSAAAADPVDPGDLWVSAEYVPTTNPCVWGTAVARLTFSTPTVTVQSATSGPPVGGTTVVLTGTDFYDDPSLKVTFGGVPATRVTVQSPNQLTAVAPPHLQQPIPATVPITVATVNGSATAPVPFTYADRVGSAPAVTWRPGTQRDGPPPPVAPSAHPARPTGSAGVLGQIMAALRYWLGSPVTGSSRSDARFGLRVVR